MMHQTVSEEKVRRMYATDRAVIVLSIIVMFCSLGFVLATILPQSPEGATRSVLIGASAAVLVLATFALLRVLSHLKKHRDSLYPEDIQEMEKNRRHA